MVQAAAKNKVNETMNQAKEGLNWVTGGKSDMWRKNQNNAARIIMENLSRKRRYKRSRRKN
jgi:hypothetical protein